MMVFLATQDAVDFHHMLLSNILSSEDEDEDEKMLFFRLHGDMAQKVIMAHCSVAYFTKAI